MNWILATFLLAILVLVGLCVLVCGTFLLMWAYYTYQKKAAQNARDRQHRASMGEGEEP